MNGIIFDIKRFAVHDGPGIRTTVFFKGCPLHCLWCHNPEGVDPGPELMFRASRCARNCLDCVNAVSGGPLSKVEGQLIIDRSRLDDDACLRASAACLYDALQMVGRRVTVEELVQEIEKDRIFYEQSGGGVTFSGGEPLQQHEFLSKLLDELKRLRIPAALDTAGAVSFAVLNSIARNVDLVLYDLKIMDDEKHKFYTGLSNRLILDNLKKLSATGKEIWIRIPLIAGVNDDDENIRQTADFLKTMENISWVSPLPYHKGGCEKYKNLGRESEFRSFESPSAERIDAISKILSDNGLRVKRGG